MFIACGTFGIIGTDLVRDSSGESVGGGATQDGISAGRAINCTGVANGGRGIFADHLITNCEGTSTSGIGLSSGTASFSRGKRDGATAIAAPITIGCTVNGTGTVASAQKFLGTP